VTKTKEAEVVVVEVVEAVVVKILISEMKKMTLMNLRLLFVVGEEISLLTILVAVIVVAQEGDIVHLSKIMMRILFTKESHMEVISTIKKLKKKINLKVTSKNQTFKSRIQDLNAYLITSTNKTDLAA
jgi:hypothetical protein